MQVNFGGAVCVAGTCTKDAELKYVGEKKTPMCTFSLAVGKRQDTTTIFANCKAWRSLAVQASQVHKGDSVFAVGTVLFLMTLAMNLLSIRLVRRYREVYE